MPLMSNVRFHKERANVATTEDIAAFIAREFPQTKCAILEIGNGGATVSHEVGPSELRPGGTVSGPVLMATADVALYVAILGEIGIVPLAVTTSLNINFLRKLVATARVIGVCKLIKLVWCATLFCTYRMTAARAAFARVTLARMSEAVAVQMKGLGCAL